MENANRITNICYPRGSVVYAKFDKNSEYYYLNMRPLIVVSHQMQMFDSLTAIGCGSRDRPGIEISLYNHNTLGWVGGHQYSIAQPYVLVNIIVRQIVDFHGCVDPWTMKAIDKAMAFHLGLSDEVPPYMMSVYKELMEPVYRGATEDNTQLKDPHQLGSPNDRSRKFNVIPKIMNDPGQTYTKSKDETSLEEDQSNKSGIDHSPVTYTIPLDKDEPVNIELAPSKRQGKSVLIIPEDSPRMNALKEKCIVLAASLTEDERIKVITRKLSNGDKIILTNTQIYGNMIAPLRNALENAYGLTSGKFANKIRNKLNNRQSNFKFLTEFERVCAVLYCTPEELDVTTDIFKNIAKIVKKKYSLNFADKRYWRNLKNFEYLNGLLE